VLESFPSQYLKKLSLFARLLTPQLIDVIARYCPVLNSLTLDVQSIAKSEWQSDNDVVSLFFDNDHLSTHMSNLIIIVCRRDSHEPYWTMPSTLIMADGDTGHGLYLTLLFSSGNSKSAINTTWSA
jgi:hypothetical protein